jgi:hypothetical protein
MANTSYNRIIRKLVVGFGNLFKDITLVRYNGDNSEAERFVVPIAYAAKEMYVQRLESDPYLDKKVATTLPRMSFEMNGLQYDAARKQNTNIKNAAVTSGGVVKSQYNPVPYNFDFSLYLYVRNIEDGTQIIEHILPYFTPDYTIKLNLVPEMGIIKEVPVILNDTQYEVLYEGDRMSETRMIIWTLNFTVKGFVYGQTSAAKQIYASITNFLPMITPTDTIDFNITTGLGKYREGENVYQGYSLGTSTATARVALWDGVGKILKLTNINGNFVSALPIIGTVTNANYMFTSYQTKANVQAQIIVVPNPTDANANSLYTYTTVINETPNIQSIITTSTTFAGDLMTEVGVDDLSTEIENKTDFN